MTRRATHRRPLVVRRQHVLLAVGVLLVGAGVVALWRAARSSSRQEAAAGDLAGEPLAPALPEPPPESLPRREATVYWPTPEATTLRPRQVQIFATSRPVDQAKQVVEILLQGPGEEGLVAPLPAGTRLRALFIDRRGVAYVDLSAEAQRDAPGGSAWERLAVGAVVNSLLRSVPQVVSVQVLVDGREVETLAGHLDLREPLRFDEGLVAAP